jgi:EmrB/QacA subfamily drug resistance transporter
MVFKRTLREEIGAQASDLPAATDIMAQTQTKSPSSPLLSHTEIRSVVIGLMLAIMLGAIEQTIVSVALPKMAAELQGFEQLSWVVSGYLVAMAVSTPIYGKLGDLYGRRATLSFAIGLFLLASVFCALAQSMPMLVFARVLQGLGGGGLISVAQAIIADVVSPRERGRYQAYISAAFAVASVSGPVAGGLLTEYLSWRWIFWINLPLGLAALIISRRALVRLAVPRVKRPIDYIGAVLLSIGLTAVLIGITRVGQGVPWLAPDNLRLFALGSAVLAAFVWQEKRAVEPIIPFAIFRHRTIAVACVVLFVAMFQLIALSVLIPLQLQMTTGVRVDEAAYHLVPLTLAVPFGAFVSGRLMNRVGRYRPSQLTGATLVPVGVLAFAFTDVHSAAAGAAWMIVLGIGIGMQLPASMVAVQNTVPPQHMGIATATTSFFRSFGAAIGIAILTAILLATLRENAPAVAASLSGAEILSDLAGGAFAGMGEAARAQLTTAVQGTFRTTFVVSGVVALASVLLLLMTEDVVLQDKRKH